MSDAEHDALAHCFQQLITCLMGNEETDEETQQRMATMANVDVQRIDGIAEFLNHWDNEQPKAWPMFYTARKLSRYTLQIVDLIRRRQ